jgi:antitoxin MazE
MRVALRKMGNSSGVIIPKPFLAEIGAQSGEDVEMALENGRIVIAAARRHPREDWAEASRYKPTPGTTLLSGRNSAMPRMRR